MTCSSIRNKRYRLRHPERSRRIARENKRRFRIKNPLQTLILSAKQRAKKKDIEFDITVDDLYIPLKCPVFNSDNTQPSIDRIDNSKGYVKGNVRVISTRANRLKSDMTLDECKLILKDLENCQILLNAT